MQATLDAYSLKGFTKALTCLSRYGEELSIFATTEFLSLSATNAAKSAYCRFKYSRQFFSKFKLNGPTRGGLANDGRNVSGQLLAKTLLSILKHRTVEKSVERCELSIIEGNDNEGEDEDGLENKLVLRLHCKHGVVKTHRLPLLALGTLLAPGVPDATNVSRLTIGPKVLKDLLDHFPISKSARSDPQLVWTFDITEIGLKSVESAIDSRGKGQLSTELTISSEEFDEYDIYESPTTIAFHLREFTASITFADSISQPLEFRFTDPAAPLFIDLEGDNVESLFVISTSQVHGVTPSTQRTSSQAVNTKKRERSESETPRIKKSMKVVQPANPEMYDNKLRLTSRAPGSMPPPSVPLPSMVANRFTFNAAASHGSNHAVGPSEGEPTRHNEPLFLPASQLSVAEEAVIRSAGLGIENMNAAELAEMLEGDGEEVDFSYLSQPGMPNLSQTMLSCDNDAMLVDEPDSLEIIDDSGLDATQSNRCEKAFQPLFED